MRAIYILLGLILLFALLAFIAYKNTIFDYEVNGVYLQNLKDGKVNVTVGIKTTNNNPFRISIRGLKYKVYYNNVLFGEQDGNSQSLIIKQGNDLQNLSSIIYINSGTLKVATLLASNEFTKDKKDIIVKLKLTATLWGVPVFYVGNINIK